MHEEKAARGWAIVGASFMLGFVIAARNSVGLTMPFRKEDPGWSYKFVATVGGAATMAIAAPAAGAFAAMSLVSTTVAHRFRTSPGLAASAAASGSADGQLALMPLLAFPATAIAWRDAFAAPGRRGARRLPSGRPGAASTRFLPGAFPFRLRCACLRGVPCSGSCGFFVCGFTTAGTVKIRLVPFSETYNDLTNVE